MYEVFGKYGPIRQIRIGTSRETKGTGFVVYDDIYDAKNACEHLSGYSLLGRYLIVQYHQLTQYTKKVDLEKKRLELEKMKQQLIAQQAEHI